MRRRRPAQLLGPQVCHLGCAHRAGLPHPQQLLPRLRRTFGRPGGAAGRAGTAGMRAWGGLGRGFSKGTRSKTTRTFGPLDDLLDLRHGRLVGDAVADADREAVHEEPVVHCVTRTETSGVWGPAVGSVPARARDFFFCGTHSGTGSRRRSGLPRRGRVHS